MAGCKRPLYRRIENFWSYIKKRDDGHWLWLGKIDKDGYGHAWWNDKQQPAHRVAWEIVKGESLPFGIDLHHEKDCPRNCVNPEHLKPLLHPSHAGLHNRRRNGAKDSRA